MLLTLSLSRSHAQYIGISFLPHPTNKKNLLIPIMKSFPSLPFPSLSSDHTWLAPSHRKHVIEAVYGVDNAKGNVQLTK